MAEEAPENSAMDIEGAHAKGSRMKRILFDLQKAIFAKGKLHIFLLLLSILGMLVGFTSGPLLLRFYFVHGGERKWLISGLQSAGWPLLAVAIAIIYWKKGLKLTPITPALGAAYVLLGVLAGFDYYMFAWGAAYLSASTFGLLTASQLIFTAIFAMLITRQKINVFGWNSIVLVSTSAVLLALHADSDRLPGVTKAQYMTGFFVTIAASALYGLSYPLTEIVFKRFLAGTSKKVILEMQLWFALVASVVALIGMTVNGDFEAMQRESKSFSGGGRLGYWMTLFWSVVASQVGSLGAVGIIFLSSSLMAGLVLTVNNIPVLSIASVVVFHDNFGALKIMTMLLSLWGFMSYLYGGYLEEVKR